MGEKENEVKRIVFDFLEALPCVAFVQQIDQISVSWRRTCSRYHPKGRPDLQGHFQGGRAFYFELKAPGGKLSKEQEAFLSMATKTGALAAKVDSVEALRAVLVTEGYLDADS